MPNKPFVSNNSLSAKSANVFALTMLERFFVQSDSATHKFYVCV